MPLFRLDSRTVCVLAPLLLLVRQTAALPPHIPNDPDFPLQWSLRNSGQEVQGVAGTVSADIHATEAWGLYRGTSPVILAIVGSGVDPHPEFASRLLEGASMMADPFDSLDGCGVGTHVAGIIAGESDNGVGIAGVHSKVVILPVRVLDGCSGAELATANGIRWAVDQGASVILAAVQFGSGTQALREAVEYADSRDVVLVAPAGSDNNSSVAYPAAYAECLAVSATNNQDGFPSFANYGPEVDLSAPGEGILSTGRDGTYATIAEAWAAAPALVAGVAALLRSYAPQLTAAEIKQILLESADDLGEPGWDAYFGWGRVNALRALELAPPLALRFEPVETIPTTIPPGTTASFQIRIAEVAESVVPGSPTLWHRTGTDAFTSQPLTNLGGGLFGVQLPALPCDTTVEYYLSASGNLGTEIREPLDAPDSLYSTYVTRQQVLFADDFEAHRGWEVATTGGDTLGAWVRVAPVGTLGAGEAMMQPGYDYSKDAKTMCYVTGQHNPRDPVWADDVDGGPVVLTSPTIPLTAPDAEISYARWFYWNGVDVEDVLTVELSRNDGLTWTTAETVRHNGAWARHSFRLRDFPEVTGDQLRVRFTTSDDPRDSLTEAAIDEFEVRAILCIPANGDYDGSRGIDLADFHHLAMCLTGPVGPFLNELCGAFDFDGDRDVDSLDVAVFQNRFGIPVGP